MCHSTHSGEPPDDEAILRMVEPIDESSVFAPYRTRVRGYFRSDPTLGMFVAEYP